VDLVTLGTLQPGAFMFSFLGLIVNYYLEESRDSGNLWQTLDTSILAI